MKAVVINRFVEVSHKLLGEIWPPWQTPLVSSTEVISAS